MGLGLLLGEASWHCDTGTLGGLACPVCGRAIQVGGALQRDAAHSRAVALKGLARLCGQRGAGRSVSPAVICQVVTRSFDGSTSHPPLWNRHGERPHRR